MSGPIPVTILTGFLGAGKTTLLNALLKQPEMANTAVLINEFGEIGLDHLLVERLDGDTVLLNAGCLCCTIRGDLLTALDGVWDRMLVGQAVARVVVETTGLADPAPILHTLMADPRLARRFVLDGVVTLVDAATGMATLDTQPEALRQAAVADRIVLTKTDLVPPAQVAALQDRLAALNPVAPILAAIAGDVPAARLLDAGPYDTSAKAPAVATWIGAAAPHGHHHGHHHHHHDRNRHDSSIQALCLEFDEPLPWSGLAGWLEMLAMTRGASVLRVKGLLDLQGEDRPVVIHGVQHLFHPPIRLAAWPEGTPRRSRLVFILRQLEPDVVRNGLDAFLRAARDEAALGAG
ncbi:GTP-binding protein [Roseomonas frigidaquae]|uniref:GTP-binding protein n=1 Tax=Falsiroseomonas frigidaquae TaxID=487318 RepID=A0ABX1F5Y3_9PROT|nr:GTP-binding protein [Falsiroseomonas frigidaquae]NKE47792.1 GTP-binding protein [Falsiroseomonas frigidaquae]